MKNFGGIGVAIMNYKTTFETEFARLNELSEQLHRQGKVAVAAGNAATEFLAEKLLAPFNSLQKIMTASAMTKALASQRENTPQFEALKAQAANEREKLDRLLVERDEATARCKAALSDFAKFATEGRMNFRPSSGRFSIVSKGGASRDSSEGLSSFELPAERPGSIDPMESLAGIQIARRFQR